MDRDSLQDAIQSSPLTSMRQHAKRLGVGAVTVRQTVVELGRKSLVIVKRPLLRPAICVKRLERCQRLMNDLKSTHLVGQIGLRLWTISSQGDDPFILSELEPWKIQINSVVTEEIGKTYVFLDGNRLSCRMRECNLGNLETDAVIHLNAKFPDDMEWARTSLAVINGGGIRSSIDERASNGSITMEDILTVAPFQNTIDIVELRGRDVKAMFEHSVESYDAMALDPGGRFLQVSGFVVVYDITRPPGARVVRLQARCISCRVPTMEDVRDEDVYKIAMPSFIANGGDGYTVVRDQKIKHHLTGLLDTDVYSQYIQMVSPIYQGIENRILFIDSSSVCSDPNEPPPLAVDEDLQQLGVPDGGPIQDALAEPGPAHNPFLIAPHEMVNEIMMRHDIYFRKYYEKKLKKEKKRLLAEKNDLKVATLQLQERLEEIKKHELKVKFHEQILQGLDHLQDIDSAVTVVQTPLQFEEKVIQPIRGGTDVLPPLVTGAQNFGSIEIFPSGFRGATLTTLPRTQLKVGSPVMPSPKIVSEVMNRDVFQTGHTDVATASRGTEVQGIVLPNVRDIHAANFPDALTNVRQIDPGSHVFDIDVINFADGILA
ncbi:5'-Nucleotidase C-terminal [Trinorchestia longiramus]|nr:5'-Nucleotidase C-terminal [Trinorchestia longiramus]